MYQQRLQILKTRANALRKIVQKHLGYSRKRFWLEVIYIVVTYVIFTLGIIFPPLEGKLVALGLGATSSVRVPGAVKEVILKYLDDVNAWKRPIDAIEVLIKYVNPNDQREIEYIEERLERFRARLLKAASLQ